MKTKVKNISDVKVELTISLGVEELKAAEQVALTKLAKKWLLLSNLDQLEALTLAWLVGF